MDSHAFRRLRQYSLSVTIAVLMTGCGGGGEAPVLPPVMPGTVVVVPAKYAVGGTISGLGPGAALTLAYGSEKLVVGANGNFVFPNKVERGSAYTVTAVAPAGYTCRVSDGAGVVAEADVNKIAVACAPVLLAGVVGTLQAPLAVQGDGAGNLYVLDSAAASVLKISAAGAVTVVAGGSGHGFVNGSGAAARFGFSQGDLAVDAQGNILVADGCNNAIRKIKPDGEVSTLGGGGPEVCRTTLAATSGGTTVHNSGSAQLSVPHKIIPDGAGGALVLDSSFGRSVVHTVSATGVVTTQSWTNPTPNVGWAYFVALARGADGILYLADARQRLWKDVAGTLVLVAGSQSGTPRDGTGAAATFRRISDMVAAPDGNLYLADSLQVRRVTPAGVVTTVAGLIGFNLGNDAPGSVRFGSLKSITLDGSGLVVLDESDNTLHRVGFDGAVSRLAATPLVRGTVDGAGSAARFNSALTLAADPDGNLYTADSGNSQLRKITPDGSVARFGGAPDGFGLITGPLASATFKNPHTVAAGRDGALWVAQPYNLRRIQNDMVTTVTPDSSIVELAVDADGNAIAVELPPDAYMRVVRITPAGQLTVLVTEDHVKTLLKDPTAGFEPEGIVGDAAGNLYIADRATAVVYKLAKSGELSVFAGTPLKDTGNVDGPAGTATLGFYGYAFLAIDDKGNLYISGQGKVRMISPAGVVSTPDLGWGNASITALAYAKGKLYGMTRYAILQTWLP